MEQKKGKHLLALVLALAMCLSIVSANAWARDASGDGSGSAQSVEEVNVKEAAPEAESAPEEAESEADPEETTAPKQEEESELPPEEEKPAKLETQGVIGMGTCGINVSWTLDDEGTLTISGNGAMTDYSWGGAPWYSQRWDVEKVVVQKGVTSVGEYAFYECSSLTSISIPDSVKTIKRSSLSGCTCLTSITIPDSVTSIGRYAFYSCTNLKSITIPDDVTIIGDYAFSGCTSLTSVNIPDSVTKMNSVFSGCTSLTSVNIPDSVTEMSGAFSGCISLTSVKIPNSVTLMNNTFSGCSSLTSITIPDSVTQLNDSFSGCSSLTGITIPDSVTDMDGTFYGCCNLASITIPEGVAVTRLNRTFEDCSSLTSVTIPNSVTSLYCTFYGCSSLASVTIPESVTGIDNCAFYDCSSLASVTIPNSVTGIGGYAFYGCTNLTSVTIPNSVTHIGSGAFLECTNLTSVIIKNGVSNIDSSAFKNCSSLTSVTIPNSVTRIGTEAFGYYYDDMSGWYYKMDGLTIYGYTGSAAETYASEEGFIFISLDTVYEDETIPIFFDDIYPAWYKTEYFSKKNPSTKSNNELAMMAGILSWAVYGDDGKPTMKDVLHSLNIPDADILEEGKREDSLCYAIARKRIRVDGKLTNLLILDARGTLTDDERILDMTTVANQHFFGQIAYNGIYGFEAKIMEGLNNYLTSHPDIMEQPLKVLITGHSLGGAAANLLGARFTMFADSGSWWAPLCTKEDIYVYTFASIDSIYTNGTIYEGYENIHNITNFYDTFGPEGLHIFTAAGNSRYGKYGHIDIFYKNIMNVSDVVANHMWGAYLRAVRDHEVQYENPKAQKIASMHCPVDVDVYRDNVLVGRVVNNEVVSEVSTIPISVVNDVKYFALLGDGDYSFDIKATDDGEMKINVADAETGQESRTFDNIALTSGKQMYTAVYEDAPLDEMTVYVVDGQQTILSEVQEDGTETEPSEDACIHVWSADYTTDKEATDFEDGSESRHCEKCGRKKTGTERVIPKLILFGDLTGDGDVTMADVVLLNRYILGKLDLTAEQKALADVNHDNDITMADVVLLNRFVVGLIKSL